MNLEDLFTAPKHSIWDNAVPIITTDSGDVTAYISDQIDEAFTYNELCYRLKHAPAEATVTLHLNTPGGYLHSAMMLVDAIKNAKAKTVAYLTGTVASAGTIIALSCDELIVSDHLSFMIHNYSASGLSGKAHELKAYQTFTDLNTEKDFRFFYKNFLTEKEMNSVIDGQDLWMNSEEVIRRWTNKVSKKEEPQPIATSKRGRPKKS